MTFTYVKPSERNKTNTINTQVSGSFNYIKPSMRGMGGSQPMSEEKKEEEKRKKLEEELKKQNEIPVNEEPISIEEVNDEGFLKKASRDIGGSIKSGELFKAIGVGAENAINQTADMLSDVGGYVEDKLNLPRIVFGDDPRTEEVEKGIRLMNRDSVEQAMADGVMNMRDTLTDAVFRADLIEDDLETVTGKIVRDISQFGTGFLLTRRALGLGKGFKGSVVAGAITEGTVFDPMEDNMSAILKEVPALNKIIPDYLATDMDDSKLANRLRNVGEGAIFGAAFDVIFLSAKRLKNSRKARDEITENGKVSEKTMQEGDAIEEQLESAIAKNKPPTKEAINSDIKQAKVKQKKFDIKRARANTDEETKLAKLRAKKVSEGNRELSKRMLKEFEEVTGKDVTKKDAKGNIIGKDDAKYRLYREEILIANADDFDLIRKRNANKKDTEIDFDSTRTNEELITPFMREEYFDRVIAVAADLRDKAIKSGKKDPFKDGKVIDNLFDLTVTKELLPPEELIDTLAKFNLSFEDFMLVVVGQGSEFGRGLQKFGALKGVARPENLKISQQAQDALEQQGKIRQFVMRVENLRRGSMVSSIATASRNLTSAMIRSPLESIGNIMDAALQDAVEGGIGKGLKTLASPRNFMDSLSQTKYLLRNNVAMKQYADFLFEQEGMEKYSQNLLGQLNEIRRKTGRVEGDEIGKLEFTLQRAEDVVDFLNIPNRVQEFAVRRSVFFGELQRLMRREWDGADLFDLMNEGKINDVIKNAPTVRPTRPNAMSFEQLMDEATRKALDITYAKQPDIKFFRDMTQFITENGLTVIIPFPRFMFNSIELVATYGAGASVPLTKAISGTMKRALYPDEIKAIRKKLTLAKTPAEKTKLRKQLEEAEDKFDRQLTLNPNSYKNLTARDREKITRNTLGWATAIGFIQYRMSDDAPSDYKKLPSEMLNIEGGEIDTTPQFPLRQYLYVGEAVKRLRNGTFGSFFNMKEFTETFAGTNIRTGVGHSIIEDISVLAAGSSDLLLQERISRFTGKALGQYLSSWAIPVAQGIEVQRAMGGRPLSYMDLAEDPELGGDDVWKLGTDNYYLPISKKEVVRPLRQRGFVSPKTEEEAPFRGGIFKEGESRERVAPFARLLGGINITEKDSEEGEYLKSFGFTEYGLGSKSRVPSIRRTEDSLVQVALPSIVDGAKRLEKQMKKDYAKRSPEYKEKFSERKHIDLYVKEYVNKTVSKIRSNISMGKFAKSERPKYQMMQYNYRKLTSFQRQGASQVFFRKYNREADPSDLKDLGRLVGIGSKLKMK